VGEDKGYEKAAHLYDLFDGKENIEFFFHYAAAAGEILDIGAGTGRIAIPLAERGVEVYCVEPSPAMRREFKKKLSQHPHLWGNITLQASDARHFDFGRAFPAAFLSGSFDHFLNDKERLASLCNIGRHLVTGGKLVFDVFLGLMRDSPLSPAGRVQVGDRECRRFVATKVLPHRTQETHLVFETYQDGELVERLEERSKVGLIAREELHQLLKQTGFEVKQEFGHYDFSGFQEGDPLLIVEAENAGAFVS
jgi:SAM-dependent methyltransferase